MPLNISWCRWDRWGKGQRVLPEKYQKPVLKCHPPMHDPPSAPESPRVARALGTAGSWKTAARWGGGGLSHRGGRRVGEHGIQGTLPVSPTQPWVTKRGARPDACTTKTCCWVGRSQPIAARPMSMCRPLAKCGKRTSSTGCTVTRPPCMQS